MTAPDDPVGRARDTATNSKARQEAEDAPDDLCKDVHQREMRTHARAARVHEDAARAHEVAIRLNEEHIAHLEQEWSQGGLDVEEELHDEPETDA